MTSWSGPSKFQQWNDEDRIVPDIHYCGVDRLTEHPFEPFVGESVPAKQSDERAQQHSRTEPSGQSTFTVVYPRGPVAGIPHEHASRRERFAELDELQPRWQVELRSRGAGGTVDAVFFSPTGVTPRTVLAG